jgi:hypothetical protein
MRTVHGSLFEVSLAAFAAIGLPVTLISSLSASSKRPGGFARNEWAKRSTTEWR